MNKYLVADAISFLDAEMLAEHLKKKEKAKKKKNIFRTVYKSIGGVAACLLLVFMSIFAFHFFKDDKPPVTTPDNVYSFLIGEECKSTVGGVDYYVVIDSAVLTREIDGEKKNSGGYLILGGKIDTTDFALLTEEIELEINIAKITDDRRQTIVFEKELSDTLSDVDLLFDEEVGAMNGDFCLVFSIDETDCLLIESKTTQTSFENDQGVQIRLNSNIFWGGGKTVFDFRTSDVEVAETE